MKSWDELSMAEKADVMKLAIDGGVYDLDSIRSGYNEYAKGGKIHIDPSKKGTFTAAASKHGKSVQAFASQVLAHPENYSPAMRKKANFARNAAKWEHAEGGNLYPGGGFMGLMPTVVPAALRGIGNAIKERAYKTITPQSYNISKAAKEFISGKERNLNGITPERNEEWARYLGVPYNGESSFEPSPYRPTKGQTYDTVLRFKDESQILSDRVLNQMLERQKKTGKNSFLVTGNGGGLGSYTLSLGEDEKGKYISYYDDWDINPFKGINARTKIPFVSTIEDIVPGSNPFTVYGRRYYEETNSKKHNFGGNLYGDGGIFGDLINSLGQKIVSAGKAIGLIESAPKPTVYVSKPTGRRFKTKEEAKMDAYAYNQAVALTKKTNSIPARHIGSDNKNPFEQRKETWNQFWQQEPVMQHAVDSIANRYGVNPDALRYRLNTEGFTEGMIHQRNDSVKNNKPVDRGYHLLNQKVGENKYAWYSSKDKKWSTTSGDNAGFMIFGLDDAADYINKGQAFLINERWSDQYNTNEEGRTVHSATGETIADNIGLMGATLKMFTDQAREDFPNASDADIARYGLAYYNRGRKGGKKWAKNGAKGYYYK